MRTALALVALLLLVGLAGCVASFDGGDSAEPADPVEPPSETALAFTEVADDAGFEYTSTEGDTGNGNDGVYVADYDDDLREDVLAIGNERGEPTRNATGGPALFRNTGDGFERTDALPDVDGRVMSALWLDHDGDGWEDLLLLRRGDSPVFLENDGGDFERTDVGLADETFTNPVGASAADADGDGTLEFVVIQYGRWDTGAPVAWHRPLWGDDDNGNPNAYFDWDGDQFVRDEDAGIGPGPQGSHWSLATSFEDLTGDGHPDVHVANDYFNDTLYVNDGDGTFERHTLGGHTDRNGMSSTTADLTDDGVPEIFVTNIFFPEERIQELPEDQLRMFRRGVSQRIGKRLDGNNLLTYQGDGEYEDVGEERGVYDGGWGWGAAFVDLDSDGQQDLVQATQDVVRFDQDHPTYSTPMVWLQRGDQFFSQDAPAIGMELHDGRGLATFDYQVDGARDVLVGTYDQRYRLYRNDADQGESLQVDVAAGDDVATAVGATVEVTVDGETQRRVRSSRADYQAQDSRILHFGLGENETVDQMTVTWPDGTERTFEDVDGGQRIRVTPEGIDDRLEYGS